MKNLSTQYNYYIYNWIVHKVLHLFTLYFIKLIFFGSFHILMLTVLKMTCHITYVFVFKIYILSIHN